MKNRTGLISIMNMESTEMTTLKSVILVDGQNLAIEKIRIELNIQLTPDDRRTDRSMICVGVENFSG